jgi:hypothetical protein
MHRSCYAMHTVSNLLFMQYKLQNNMLYWYYTHSIEVTGELQVHEVFTYTV